MKKRKKGYKLLLGTTILLTFSAILTLIPNPNASKECLLGMKSICSFTPISTALLLIMAGGVCVIRKKKFVQID